MKRIIFALIVIMFLVACGNSKPQPNPSASLWNSAKWNENTWGK